MKRETIFCVLAGAWLPAVAAAQSPQPGPRDTATADSADLVTVMYEDFSRGFDAWQPQELDRRKTVYAMVGTEPDGSDAALQGRSDNAAAALVRPIDAPSAARGMVSWRWRTDASLSGNDREREKKGDDYAARIFLTFGGDPFTRGTRALAYVWAGQEPAGSVFENPYISDVMTIVLRSGDEDTGAWVAEERDFVADYEDAFGEPPPPLTAIAVLVDSDDTGLQTVARFDDFLIQVARED